MVITLFFPYRQEKGSAPALANPLKSQSKSKEYRSKMIRDDLSVCISAISVSF